MAQINLIGFSTVGKSYIAQKLASKFPNFSLFDTDEEICNPEYTSISHIYYSFERLKDTHTEIMNRESRILELLTKNTENLIIASGPGIPMNYAFPEYVKRAKPFIILLEKSPEEIYEGLIKRRSLLKENDTNPKFGIWDIDVIVDVNLNEYSKEKAVEKIKLLLDERKNHYTKYANETINLTEQKGINLENHLTKIISQVCT